MFIIFSFGFVTRVIISHFFDVNVFYDYDTCVSLIYYASMSFFMVLVNELKLNIILVFIIEWFSNFHTFVINTIGLILNNIYLYFDVIYFDYIPKLLIGSDQDILYIKKDKYKYSYVLYHEDSNKSSKHISKGKSGDGRVLSYSESPRRIRSVTIQRDYIHLRPLELSNLDPDVIRFIPAIDFNNSLPRTPRLSNLTTPSTMTPLFPEIESTPSSKSYLSRNSKLQDSKPLSHKSEHSLHPSGYYEDDVRVSQIQRNIRTDIDNYYQNMSSTKRKCILAKTNIKGVLKSLVSPSDSQIYDDYVACRKRDMQIMHDAKERERRSYLYKQAQHKELVRQERERMACYYARFGKRK